MNRGVIQRNKALEKDSFSFSSSYNDFTKLSHVSNTFPEGDWGEEGILLAQEKKGIVCLVFRLLNTGSRAETTEAVI